MNDRRDGSSTPDGFMSAARRCLTWFWCIASRTSASHESPRPTFVGLNTAWVTHSQWDAAIRAELGARPVVSSDPEPLAALWINSVQDIRPGEVPPGPVVVFSDYSDQRTSDLFAWAEKTVGSCRQSTFGGPGYGLVTLLRCG